MSYSGNFNVTFTYFSFVLWITQAIDRDYSYGYPTLRTKQLNCNNTLLQLICMRKCGKTFSCVQGNCYCDEPESSAKNLITYIDGIKKSFTRHKRERYQKKSVSMSSTEDFTDLTQVRNYKRHPALRHHIAHFCENLETARVCIRNCMKVGKPAFCGKDHVCYCGHKYNSNEKDKQLNTHDMCAQFRDLYEKYFGPNDEEHQYGDLHYDPQFEDYRDH